MDTHFRDLRESNEFLNLLLDNMNTAVLIADEDLQIHHFNGTFLQLFAKSKEEVIANKFGKISGCVFSVEEKKPCGSTSRCTYCVLRRAVLKTMVEKVPVDKMRMTRVFYIDGNRVIKYLDISTRHISFEGRKMILVMLYDVTEIETQKLELQQKQQQLDRDLSAAAGIQRSLLPQYVPGDNAVRIAWHFEPCREIGGDIFNIHHPGEDRMDLYMLDVCGHGVSAALVAVSVSQFLQSGRFSADKHARLHSPAMVLDRLEQAFPFERFDTYFTLIYMTLDMSTDTLSYASAGHPPPILLRADGQIEVLEVHGPAIGFGVDNSFNQGEKRLRPGDKVVLYTDGILEARKPDGEIYGKHRLYRLLEGSQDCSAKEIVEDIYADVKGFAQEVEFEDDISILVAEIVDR